MSPQKWIKEINAIGMISKSDRYYGRTISHSDIALEFASWFRLEFKLYVIQEFQRLKKNEVTETRFKHSKNMWEFIYKKSNNNTNK